MAFEKTAGESVEKVNAVNSPAVAEINWDQVNWSVHTQETGDQIVFDTVGDQFIGMYTGPQKAEKDGDSFTILTWIGTDGKPYQTNAGWKLEQAFSDIPNGTITRVTRCKDIDTGQPSPMKDFRVDVAYAK